LDWLQPSEDERVILAIIKLPASDFETYKGPVFINPSGPGGSGFYALKRTGKSLQRIAGVNYDLISFDPRGVGATTPIVDCWASIQNRNILALQDVGVIDSHPGVLYDAYARATALSGLCSRKLAGNGTARLMSSDSPAAHDISSFVSTTSAARDMLETLNRGGWEKLRYWGFSYGTTLGGMFATLWPEKVERMVISLVNDGETSAYFHFQILMASSGNVDYSEWTSTSHLNFLHGTDKVMNAFYHFCHLSGPSKCDFYSPSPQVIEERLDAVLMNLKLHPIVVPSAQPGDPPEVVTYTWVKRFISAALYRPINLFQLLAKTLAALGNGDGGPFLNLSGVRKSFSCDCGACGMPPELPTEL
jgi:pimeloyl-ACP methyl ester carboxylesterase